MAIDHENRSEQPRTVVKSRRRKLAERREAYFSLLVSGYSHRQIADRFNVSVRSVRLAVDRAIGERRFDSPDLYVHLQVARLTKALRATDYWIERAELKAIAPFLGVVAELDRYHGLAARPDRRRRVALPVADRAPAPPLALTQAAPQLELAEAPAQSEAEGAAWALSSTGRD